MKKRKSSVENLTFINPFWTFHGFSVSNVCRSFVIYFHLLSFLLSPLCYWLSSFICSLVSFWHKCLSLALLSFIEASQLFHTTLTPFPQHLPLYMRKRSSGGLLMTQLPLRSIFIRRMPFHNDKETNEEELKVWTSRLADARQSRGGALIIEVRIRFTFWSERASGPLFSMGRLLDNGQKKSLESCQSIPHDLIPEGLCPPPVWRAFDNNRSEIKLSPDFSACPFLDNDRGTFLPHAPNTCLVCVYFLINGKNLGNHVKGPTFDVSPFAGSIDVIEKVGGKGRTPYSWCLSHRTIWLSIRFESHQQLFFFSVMYNLHARLSNFFCLVACYIRFVSIIITFSRLLEWRSARNMIQYFCLV